MTSKNNDISPQQRAKLEQARTKINQVDKTFIELLKTRLDISKEVATIKSADGNKPLLDTGRERQVLESWAKEAENQGVSGYFAGRILREILSYSRRTQEPIINGNNQDQEKREAVRVGYQGVTNSYSDLTITKLFTARNQHISKRIGYPSFGEAILGLDNNEVDYILLPVENTVGGSISEVNQIIASGLYRVVDEEIWNVEHTLSVLPGVTKSQIKKVRSHPAAIQQCLGFIAQQLPGVQREVWSDTAESAASIKREQDPTIASICSEEAAHSHGLDTVAYNIADQRPNITRFLLVTRRNESSGKQIASKTSLLLKVDHRQGALAQCLRCLAEHEINLTRIESRSQPGSPWEYMFFMDIEGHQEDKNVHNALTSIKHFVNYLRILGTYPYRIAMDTHLDLTTTVSVPTAPAEKSNLPSISPISTTLSTIKATAAPKSTQVSKQDFMLIAGPGINDMPPKWTDIAQFTKSRGINVLYAGPQTPAYGIQSKTHAESFEFIAEVATNHELPLLVEVERQEDLNRLKKASNILEVHSRNIQNYQLLRMLAATTHPILLWRPPSAPIEVVIDAAHFLQQLGNHHIIIGDQGSSFSCEYSHRFLDVGLIAELKAKTNLQIIVDVLAASRHHTPQIIETTTRAALAAGVDGFLLALAEQGDTPILSSDDTYQTRKDGLTRSEVEQLIQLITTA